MAFPGYDSSAYGLWTYGFVDTSVSVTLTGQKATFATATPTFAADANFTLTGVESTFA